LVAEVERTTFAFAQPARPGFSEETDELFGGVASLIVRYREDGELLVYNRGEHRRGFAICTKCGYSESERSETPRSSRGREELPSSFVNHPPLTSSNHASRCWAIGEAVNPLRHRVLAARETTDVLLLDFSACLAGRLDVEPLVQTLARALHIAGARLLDLDSRELGSLIVPLGLGANLGIVIYDNVPGGAGHVLELYRLGRTWLDAALAVLYGDAEHHRRCETACLDCLLTFDAQEAMQRGLIQRRLAHRVMSELLGLAVPTT
jgi:DEAD/DEAH box helicase domain-containing protein